MEIDIERLNVVVWGTIVVREGMSWTLVGSTRRGSNVPMTIKNSHDDMPN